MNDTVRAPHPAAQPTALQEVDDVETCLTAYSNATQIKRNAQGVMDAYVRLLQAYAAESPCNERNVILRDIERMMEDRFIFTVHEYALMSWDHN